VGNRKWAGLERTR